MSTTPPEQDAMYWKQRYEQERERLVKLWIAYKTLEASLDEDAVDEDAAGADRALSDEDGAQPA
ncbi:MAG TPA: hypothetical protein VM370_06305 [Candidatus Thermoplasmatota archaeon]|nr:hypothetical protein [Candidatus Thermoplasmatota archaeon]